MSNGCLRPLFLGTAAALVAVLPAPASKGPFQRGLSYWVAKGHVHRPAGIVAVGDDQLLVQDCGKDGAWALLHLWYCALDGGTTKAWQIFRCHGCPDDPAGIFGAPGGRFLILQRNGDLCRSRVFLTERGPAQEAARKVLDAPLREAAGVGPALPGSCADLPDGSLALGYPGGVLHVVPARAADETKDPDGQGGAGGQGSWRWLLGRAPDSSGTGRSGERPMIVAADAAGRILVVDPQTRQVSRIVFQGAGTPREEVLAGASVWPFPDFVPDAARVWGDTLFVSGFPMGQAIRTLVALEPAPGQAPGEPGPWQSRFLGIGMEAEGPFAVTPGGHLALLEQRGPGIRMIRNAQAPGEEVPEGLDANCTQADLESFAKALLAPSEAGPEPALRAAVRTAGALARKRLERKPRPEAKAAPSAEDQARADAAFAELMAEETAAAQAQARRDKKKARKQRQRDQGRAVAVAETKAEAAPPAPPPAQAPAGPSLPVSQPAGVRSRPAPAPARQERWILPCGAVTQRDIALRTAAFAAGGFPSDFGGWVARQARLGDRDITAARLLEGQGADPQAAPRTALEGLGAFTLGREALGRAVRWMLLNAAKANPGREYQAWRDSGKDGHPGFSFGMYELSRNQGRTTLELRDLRAWAELMDGALAREVAAWKGITGLRARQDGSVQYAYGLTVVLGAGNQSLWSIRPGGVTSLEPLPFRGPEPPAAPLPPRPAAAAGPRTGSGPAPRAAEAKEEAPLQAPAAAQRPQRRPSVLNPRAQEFKMPDG